VRGGTSAAAAAVAAEVSSAAQSTAPAEPTSATEPSSAESSSTCTHYTHHKRELHICHLHVLELEPGGLDVFVKRVWRDAGLGRDACDFNVPGIL
jgi:hypothetical protein